MQIIAGIILLGVLIVFHELGHFLFAKLLGVRVLVFSVGFGPKLIGFKYGETEYRISAIPLGGYVRMFGESLEQDLSESEKKMSFMHQPIWRKSLIAVAGPLFNFILPIILFFFLLFGIEEVYAPKVGTVLEDSPAKTAGLKSGDIIKSVENKPVDSFGEVASVVSKNPNEPLSFVIERKSAQKNVEELKLEIVPKSYPSNNPLEKGQKVGRIGVMPAIERPIMLVQKNSPFKDLGVKDFDEIVAINNEDIDSARDLKTKIASLKAPLKVTFRSAHDTNEYVVNLPPNAKKFNTDLSIKFHIKANEENLDNETESIVKSSKELIKYEIDFINNFYGLYPAKGAVKNLADNEKDIDLNLDVGDKIVSINGKGYLSKEQLKRELLGQGQKRHVLAVIKEDNTAIIYIFRVKEEVINTIGLDTNIESLLGVSIANVFKRGDIIERNVGFFEAVGRATKQTYDIGALTIKSFFMLIKGEVPASQLGGPIMLFDVAHQAAAKGLAYYIFIMCLISVNLGILNLIPIPALDGGHLLLFGIEAVQRKPLTEKTRAIATQIGIAILLLIMALAIFNDINRLFGG